MLNSISEVQQNVSNVNNMVTNYTSKPSGYFPIAMTEFNSKTINALGKEVLLFYQVLFHTRQIRQYKYQT